MFLSAAYTNSMRGGPCYKVWEILYHINNFALLTAVLTSQVLLILYAIKWRSKRHQEVASPVDPIRLTTWNTNMTAFESINILRRREWAFLIDCAPSILVSLIAFFSLSMISTENEVLQRLVYSIAMMLEFLLVGYILFKDSIEGRSIGKRFTECRVVDLKTGVAISHGQSAVRNFIYFFPPIALIELAIASTRNDRRRIGDLIAGTIIVTGKPNQIDGVV